MSVDLHVFAGTHVCVCVSEGGGQRSRTLSALVLRQGL